MTLTDFEYADLSQRYYCLGQIPDFQGLLPKSNDAGVPVFDVTDQEIHEIGPILIGLKEKRAAFKKQFELISENLTKLLQHA